MFALRVAVRFLKSSRTQTVLIVLGLAVGIAVQLFVGLLLQNLQSGLVESVVGRSSHVTVLPGQDQVHLTDWQTMVQRIDNVSGIKTVSVAADSSAIIRNGQRSASVQVRGFVLADAERIYHLGKALYKGSLPTNDSQVIVGKELAAKLLVGVGDQVSLVSPDREAHAFWVVGLYDLGTAAVNSQWAIVRLPASQAVFKMGGNVTSIETQVRDVYTADTVAKRVKQALSGRDVTVENWKSNNKDLFRAISSQNASSYMIQSFVLASVVIGIASVLSITVLQKSRQLGILKAMGIRDSTASQIFLLEGLFLGAGGAVAGIALGTLLFEGFLQGLRSSGTSLITSNINVTFVLLSGAIAIIAAMVASLSPAIKSSRLSPIEVIRNG